MYSSAGILFCIFAVWHVKLNWRPGIRQCVSITSGGAHVRRGVAIGNGLPFYSFRYVLLIGSNEMGEPTLSSGFALRSALIGGRKVAACIFSTPDSRWP